MDRGIAVTDISNTNGFLQEELKTNHAVREREVNKQRNLDRVKIRDPANRKRISQVKSRELDTQEEELHKITS